jgi:hypothetical protein
MIMEEQVPTSQPPLPPQITPEQLEAMKAKARELAIQQTLLEEGRIQRPLGPAPQVVYVRRNLTVAELLLILCISTGIVTGFQFAWKVASENLPKIEIRIK